MFLNLKNLDFNPTKNDLALFIAYSVGNNEALSILVNNPKVDININSGKESFFDFLIENENVQILDQLLNNRPDLKIMSEYKYKCISIPNFSTSLNSYEIYKYEMFMIEFVKYFLSNSVDENTNKKKNEIITENKVFFACSLARYSDEIELEKFLDDYKIDINSIEEETILFFMFFLK